MRATAPAAVPTVMPENSPGRAWVGFFHYAASPRCPHDGEPLRVYCTERPLNGVVVQRRRCSRCGRTCKTTYIIAPDCKPSPDKPSS